MKFKNILGAVSLLLVAGSVSATTILPGPSILAPTSGDSQFIEVPAAGLDLGGFQLALFDDGVVMSDSAALYIDPVTLIPGYSVEMIAFTQVQGSHWQATAASTGEFIDLFGGNYFKLGVTTDGGDTWVPNSSVVIGANSNSLVVNFFDDNGANGSVSIIDATVVPVPAAAWLFASGLIGVVGVSRRKA